ncbi:hypothetical protein DERP_009522 [Dermatophagoides pteronyssinus]|uniref:Uncharacterized protein n=1 Tax=Dermatophagoides pteronyssinus TaxID=6956 RepID=A0ABQ8IUE1_DERPT|nr:hypothetical protein DERP_009522 [Dermatophagoides pteronyssinus]
MYLITFPKKTTAEKKNVENDFDFHSFSLIHFIAMLNLSMSYCLLEIKIQETKGFSLKYNNR